MNNKLLNKLTTIGITITTISIISLLLYFGMHTEEVIIKIDKIYTVYHIKAIAEYSENHSGYDIEGNYYSETEYWDEPASEDIVWITENGNPSNVKILDPPIYNNITKGYNFNGIKWTRNLNYYLIADLRNKKIEFNINEKEYKQILNRSNDIMRVEINGFNIIKKIK